MPPCDSISSRVATVDDLSYCVASHPRLSTALLRRKIEVGETVVCLVDGVHAGSVMTDLLWSTLPSIATIAVDESHRGRGVARAMLDVLEERARANGATRILSSSQCVEPKAQAWHRRIGFVECGVIAGHNDGIGEIFFRKSLAVEE